MSFVLYMYYKSTYLFTWVTYLTFFRNLLTAVWHWPKKASLMHRKQNCPKKQDGAVLVFGMPFKQAFISPPWKDIDVNAPLWAPQYTVAAFFLLWLYIPGKYLKMMGKCNKKWTHKYIRRESGSYERMFWHRNLICKTTYRALWGVPACCLALCHTTSLSLLSRCSFQSQQVLIFSKGVLLTHCTLPAQPTNRQTQLQSSWWTWWSI